MRGLWQAAVVVSVLAGAAGCGQALQGAIAAAPAFLITDQQAAAMGQQAAQQVLTQTPAYGDPNVQAYIQRVGQDMARHSDRPDLTYTYTVVVDPTPNAFALPGGYIFITTSLLKLMANEAELATVLAHETGHVAAGHSLQLMRDEAVAEGIETAVIGQNATQTETLAVSVLNTLLQAGHGRTKELEADRLGATYAARAGYDPSQMIVFLQALDAATGSTPAWLNLLQDHPTTAQRVAQLQAVIANLHLAGSLVNAEGFLQGTAALRGGS